MSLIVEPLIFTVDLLIRSTCAPIPAIASNKTLMSLTSGRFSIRIVSSVIIAAERIASAAFLAPPISTSPTNGLPPLITYCSIKHLYNYFHSVSRSKYQKFIIRLLNTFNTLLKSSVSYYNTNFTFVNKNFLCTLLLPCFSMVTLTFLSVFSKESPDLLPDLSPLHLSQYLRTFRTMEFFLHTDP